MAKDKKGSGGKSSQQPTKSVKTPKPKRPEGRVILEDQTPRVKDAPRDITKKL